MNNIKKMYYKYKKFDYLRQDINDIYFYQIFRLNRFAQLLYIIYNRYYAFQ